MDPRPHCPRGFEVLPHDPAAPHRCLFAYISGCMKMYNEDLAIAFLVPAIAKQDFEPMWEALKDYFINTHRVRLAEVQPSPIGDAFVRFSHPVERERFLDKILDFGQYQLRFIKHDEGDNVRFHDLDREVWVMLMLFPNDARNNTAISKAVAGFGLLRYWHDTSNPARVVARVHLHDDAVIPHDVVVSVGLPPRSRSWTCPVYVLKRKEAIVLADEDQFPPANGLLHPIPPQAPHWMGFNPEAPQQTGGESLVSDAAMPDNQGNRDEEMSADANMEEEHMLQPLALEVIPPAASPPALVETEMMPAPVVGPARPPPRLPLVPYSDDEDDDAEEVREVAGPLKSSARKRRSRKLKEPLDPAFLHRSKRLNKELGGFHDAASADEAAHFPNPYEGTASAGPANVPHMALEDIQGIATGFLQMQPEAVSAAALLELDDDHAKDDKV